MTASSTGAPVVRRPAPVFDRVVGQPRAVGLLGASVATPHHAYLFVGPHGSGKRDAAEAFAAALLCEQGGCGDCPSCRDVLVGRHPDVRVVEREGASISIGAAREISLLAQRSPAAGRRQVLVLVDFHLVDEAAPALLKTIEEPPDSTVFLVLADALPPPLVTIASRCVQVEFTALDVSSIESALEADGIPPEIAASAASAAGGRLDRARLLARDPGFATRQARWRAVPERLDGTGATVVELATELIAAPDELVAVLREQQEAELKELQSAAEQAGERRIVGRAAIEDRHKRELRRVRTDELVAGLASLAEAYRARFESASVPPKRIAHLARACEAIDEAALSLERNPNELLLLEALFLRLDAEA